MPSASDGSPWAGAVSDLLSQASAVLTREGARVYGGSAGAGADRGVPMASNVEESLIGIAARICPVTGASLPMSPADPGRLRQQAHELIAGLLGGSGQPGPFLKAGSEGDRLRRQAHELIETLLATFSGGGPLTKQGATGDQVPLLRAPAPVQAGHAARVGFRVSNE